MRWYLKSAGFKVLSAIPGGTRLYSFTQQKITHSTDATVERVEQKIRVGLEYWDWLKAHNRAERVRDGTVLDFGAGWHPTIPLLFYCFGVQRQELLDLSQLMTPAGVADTVTLLRNAVSSPDWPRKGDLKRLPDVPTDVNADVRTILGHWGMTYHTPYAPETGSLRSSVDAAICTQVLLHISRDGIHHCFRMLHDILKPGGLIMGTVHLMDLYSHTDRSITPYNHLKYSPETWERWVNTPMMPFNRFKARDYREALTATGFRIVEERINTPSTEDYAQLDKVQAHPYFNRYTRDELVAKQLFFVAEKS